MSVVKLFILDLFPRARVKNSPGIQLREEGTLLRLIFRRSDDRTRQLSMAIDHQLMNKIIHGLTHGFSNLARQAYGLIAIDFDAHHGVLLVA